MPYEQFYMQQLRRTVLAEEELIASRTRLGLFSQPPPLGMGDDSAYASKTAKRGEDGKPITQPRQILAGQNRTGQLKRSYIEVPESIHQKDPYKETFKLQLQYQNKMHSKGPMHEADFRPTACYRQGVNAPYPHVEQKQFAQKKAVRDQTGKVKTEPSNFVTNPTSRVEDKLFKHLPHKPDPYERPAEIAKQEHQLWKTKFKHEVMFKSMSHGGNNFSKNKDQYGIDDKTKMLMTQKKPHAYSNYNRVSHEAKFKPARKGHGDPIARYPEYIKPRERAHTEASHKVKTEATEDDRLDWKPSTREWSRPTPSVSLMSKNLRRHF